MISLVATVKAAKPDLDRFVTYHLNTGVAHIYLFFDDPADPALPAFIGMNRVTAIACTLAGWQAAGLRLEDGIEARQAHNARTALTWACAAGAQWLLHVDSDELIYTPGGDLADWLAQRPADCDAVTFPVLEAIPYASSRRHPFDACWLFKTTTRVDALRLKLAARAGCRQALLYGYFRGHTVGKTATRVRADIDDVGIHFPTRAAGPPLRIETAADAFVLHYDGCTFDSWRQKWGRRRDGGAGLALNMRPSRRRQLADFITADQSGSLAELEREFRRQCLIPAYEQAVLWALGLARPIRLRRDLFDPRDGQVAQD
jgi:hypothetical protein